MCITNKKDLVRRVCFDYAHAGVEFTDEFLHGIIVNMTKAEFLRAYAEMQIICNGDEVIRLKEGSLEESAEFIPESWEWTNVAGDAQQILIGISDLCHQGGPIFVRRADDGTLLDLRYGPFKGEIK